MTVPLFELAGFIDRADVLWSIGSLPDVNPLLSREHYLGPIRSGGAELVVMGATAGQVVAAQVWRRPTARRLPSDGSWLELSRWCLTPAAGDNAGTRMHRYAARLIRERAPHVTTLVSYSDPTAGHTGALYRACNWTWAPTWHRLRPPPSGNGEWVAGQPQAVKDRWVFAVRPDPAREQVLHIDDPGAIRRWQATAPLDQRRWARNHPQLGES